MVNKRYFGKPSGWRNESFRHSLASRGIKTNRYMAPRRAKTAFGRIVEGTFEAQDVRARKAPKKLSRSEAELALQADVAKKAVDVRPITPEEQERIEARRKEVGEKRKSASLFEEYDDIDILRAIQGYRDSLNIRENVLKDELMSVPDDSIVSSAVKKDLNVINKEKLALTRAEKKIRISGRVRSGGGTNDLRNVESSAVRNAIRAELSV